MSCPIGSSSTLNETEIITTEVTDLSKAEGNNMGCCTSDMNGENGANDRRNMERAKGSMHEKMDTSEETPLLLSGGTRPDCCCHKYVNEPLDQKIVHDLLGELLEQQGASEDVNNSKLQAEIDRLNQELWQEKKITAETKAALDKANKVMDEYASKMSHIMQLKNTGGYEDASNPFSPSKLGAKLKTVYEDQGLPLLGYFSDEVEGAKFVSSMIESCYDLCKKKALSQVKEFCFLDKIEVGEDDEGSLKGHIRKVIRTDIAEDFWEELCYLRWKTATSEEAINHIKETVNAFPFKDENYPDIAADEVKKAAVKSFLQECVETCWLIATCRPALWLRFDVNDLKYEAWIVKAFRVFSTQKKVQLHETPPGVIVSVVCPALLTVDDIILRGEVIVTA